MAEIEAADVLDRMANPHPRMWGEARLAYRFRFQSVAAMAYWEGYLSAMSAATGYERVYFMRKFAAEAREHPAPIQHGGRETPVEIR